MPDTFPKFLTAKDEAKLLLAFSVARGARGFTPEEAAALLTWAELVSLKAALVQMAISGVVALDIAGSNTTDLHDGHPISILKLLGQNAYDEYQITLNAIDNQAVDDQLDKTG